MIKILIVDDMLLLRDTLTDAVNAQKDMQVLGTASHSDALDMCKKLTPDLAIIGVSSGIVAPSLALSSAEDIRRELPEVKIVIMADGPDAALMDAARNTGVNSFVYKNAGLEHLLYVIRSTMTGRGVYPGPCEPGSGGDKAL